MNSDLGSIVRQFFGPFAESHGFTRRGEVSDGETYSIEYASDLFVIRLERYRYELYPTLYKAGFQSHRVHLFNLVAYLTDPSQNVSHYFPEEPNPGERFRKQVIHITATLDEYWTTIVQFFSTPDYLAKYAEGEALMIARHPELFKRS